MNEAFQRAIPLIHKIENSGFKAYFVGGSVRDFFQNREIADVDIATSATPLEIKQIFKQTFDIGIEHGTVLVIYKGIGYEITTFRAESDYKDFRHPEKVDFIRSLYKDLERRDFTMNAIAMNVNGEIIDPFNGRDSIAKKRIETVGSADERFQEDALRMMRAIRFVSQLGFSLHPDTEVAIKDNAHLMKHIAVERITAEFIKLLNGPNKKEAIHLLLMTGLGKYLPGLNQNESTLQHCTRLEIDILSEQQMWLLILFLYDPNTPTDFLRLWKLPLKKIKSLTRSLSFVKQREKEEWKMVSLYQATEETAIDVEVVYQTIQQQSLEGIIDGITSLFVRMPIKSREEITVSGKDLMIWLNRGSGPWIKAMLNKIEEALLKKEVLNEKDAIKEWVLTCNHQRENGY